MDQYRLGLEEDPSLLIDTDRDIASYIMEQATRAPQVKNLKDRVQATEDMMDMIRIESQLLDIAKETYDRVWENSSRLFYDNSCNGFL